MKNTIVNRKAIKKIAAALGELNERVVYVGGALVSLYINDPSADDVRPTADLDISMEIASVGELEKIREELTQKGFVQKAEDKIVCRFNYEGIKVDVMATEQIGWTPANIWFKPGFNYLQKVKVDEQQIRILSLDYFLATKISAFNEREKKEPRSSKDLEDISYTLDNRIDLVEQVSQSPKDVKKFLQEEFKKILEDDSLKEAIFANIYYEMRDIRFENIIQRLKAVSEQ